MALQAVWGGGIAGELNGITGSVGGGIDGELHGITGSVGEGSLES